jgi:poly-gamma-glutamate capsule biosynthesis protein CapA/YwtB (metallophosphatase superfamily)
MDLPLPDVSHQLSIKMGEETYTCDVSAIGLPILNYYAIVLVFEMEDKFFEEFEFEEIFLNQYYPVENYKSALSNLKALETNTEWVVEQAYRAFQEADWTFDHSTDEESENTDE